MIEFIPLEGLTDPHEVQIESKEALPIINGKAVRQCYGFAVMADKVKIFYWDYDEAIGDLVEKTGEFDAKDVKLSGWPADS